VNGLSEDARTHAVNAASAALARHLDVALSGNPSISRSDALAVLALASADPLLLPNTLAPKAEGLLSRGLPSSPDEESLSSVALLAWAAALSGASGVLFDELCRDLARATVGMRANRVLPRMSTHALARVLIACSFASPEAWTSEEDLDALRLIASDLIRRADDLGSWEDSCMVTALSAVALDALGVGGDDTDDMRRLARAMSLGDPIGGLLRTGDTAACVASVEEAAAVAGMPADRYLEFLLAYFLVDASSYTADATMPDGRPGFESLDWMFEFDHENATLGLSPEPAAKIAALREALD